MDLAHTEQISASEVRLVCETQELFSVAKKKKHSKVTSNRRVLLELFGQILLSHQRMEHDVRM